MIILEQIGSRVLVSGYVNSYYPNNADIEVTYNANDTVTLVIVGFPAFSPIPIANLDINNTGLPIADQADFNARMLILFPNPGSGGVQTWQNTLSVPNGSLMTKNNYIDNQGYDFYLNNMNSTSFETLDGGYLYFGNGANAEIFNPQNIILSAGDEVLLQSQTGQQFNDVDGSTIKFGNNSPINIIHYSGSFIELQNGFNSIELFAQNAMYAHDNTGNYFDMNPYGLYLQAVANLGLNSSQAIGIQSSIGTFIQDADSSYFSLGNSNPLELYTPNQIILSSGTGLQLFDNDTSYVSLGGGGQMSLYSLQTISIQSDTSLFLQTAGNYTLFANEIDLVGSIGHDSNFSSGANLNLSAQNEIVLNSNFAQYLILGLPVYPDNITALAGNGGLTNALYRTATGAVQITF